MTASARFTICFFGVAAIASGFLVSRLNPPQITGTIATVETSPTPDTVATLSDLTLTKATVRLEGTGVTKIFRDRGTVRFLIGQWGGCDDVDATYVQYIVAGRLDQPAGAVQPAVYIVGADLFRHGWADGRNAGNDVQIGLLFTRSGMDLQLNQGAKGDPTMLYELRGPCLHGPAGSENLVTEPATSVPQR